MADPISEVMTQSPQVYAAEQLAYQLVIGQAEKADVTIDALRKIGLTDDVLAKRTALSVLGKYVGTQFQEGKYSWRDLEAQRKACHSIAVIAITTEDPVIRAEAVNNLGRRLLDVTDTNEGVRHAAVVQAIGTIATGDQSAGVKGEAVSVLTNYAGKVAESKGSIGSTAFPKVQELATNIVATIVVPTPQPAQAP